ncbi:MAG: malate synthase A [Candidatus Eisenbacteria bacterium]|uniref:Malate synthase n=1 Tax=Eiseniibacteriota bacterium TaxID=2212470 RepID=A0A956LZZ8_UNCEI|nr:malate synthase A [Candidatus Eisenbacteria bacterium]
MTEARSGFHRPTGGIRIHGGLPEGFDEVLSPAAVSFLDVLGSRFFVQLQDLRKQRVVKQSDASAAHLGFPASDPAVADPAWRVADAPVDLVQRVVEITGPVDRKMIVRALGSGADVFMADFEDSTSPTWTNLIAGQINLRDAVRRRIDFVDPGTGKEYRLPERTATLMVRPRGLHLDEANVEILVPGAGWQPYPAALLDFGLFFFHNARPLIEQSSGPYFYLPKLEHRSEARFWNQVFLCAQELLGIPRGTIRATVLIETLPAAFQMEEILFELREHSAGLNCGRWDYIFSFIKNLRGDPAAVLPDRSLVTMEQPFLTAYTRLAIQTCHRRGAHAIGGMAAYIPVKNDPVENELALSRVYADKKREAREGHDGTWVAHPGLIEVARRAFHAEMIGSHQRHRLRDDVKVTTADLLRVPAGARTASGLRLNLRVGVQYLEAWLRGSGCVPLYNLMEDAATAEISRAQIWQWVRHRAILEDGATVTATLVRELLDEELVRIRGEVGPERFDTGRFDVAARLFLDLAIEEDLP